MKRSFSLLGGILLIACNSAQAGSVNLPGLGQHHNVNVVSFKEARFRTIYKQQYDFSCGSAALASLLTFHYGFPVTEKDVFDSMYEHGDVAKIRREGFSLLDMKLYLKRNGFDADGYRLSLEQFSEKAAVPAIALVNTSGYNHFIIIKGIRTNELVIGDPAKGVRVVDRNTFKQEWNGISFLIKSHLHKGRATFSQPVDWQVQTKAPFGTALSNQSLSLFTMLMPQSGNY